MLTPPPWHPGADFLVFFSFLMRMHPYTYLCPPARLSACPSQLALGKDDINAHPLRPMSYWLSYSDLDKSGIFYKDTNFSSQKQLWDFFLWLT